MIVGSCCTADGGVGDVNDDLDAVDAVNDVGLVLDLDEGAVGFARPLTAALHK